MLVIGICALLCIHYLNVSFPSLNNKIYGTYMGIMCGVVINFAIAVCLAVDFTTFSEFKEDVRVNIVSVENKSSIQGSFVLGSGYIGNSPYYFAMKDLGNDEYKACNIETDEVDYIKESNSIKPCIIQYKSIVSNPIMKTFFFKDFVVNNNYKYVIVVPKGTVIKKYNVN